MLTYDDLDHFDSRTMAGLFDPAVALQEQAGTAMRRERILASLHFCRDVSTASLAAGGLEKGRRLLRRALRSQQRDRCPPPAERLAWLEGALLALGENPRRNEESPEIAALRHAVEREIESAARTRFGMRSAFPALLAALAQGDFEIGPASRVADLEEAGRRFGAVADIEVELLLDECEAAAARIRLAVACGLWRWSLQEGGWVEFAGGEALPLAADDELPAVLLSGISVQGGRLLAQWAAAVQAAEPPLN